MVDYIQSRLSIKSCLEKILKSMHKFKVSAYNKSEDNKGRHKKKNKKNLKKVLTF